MDAIYFGNLCWFRLLYGDSSLVEADMKRAVRGGNGPFPGNTGNASPL